MVRKRKFQWQIVSDEIIRTPTNLISFKNFTIIWAQGNRTLKYICKWIWNSTCRINYNVCLIIIKYLLIEHQLVENKINKIIRTHLKRNFKIILIISVNKTFTLYHRKQSLPIIYNKICKGVDIGTVLNSGEDKEQKIYSTEIKIPMLYWKILPIS